VIERTQFSAMIRRPRPNEIKLLLQIEERWAVNVFLLNLLN